MTVLRPRTFSRNAPSLRKRKPSPIRAAYHHGDLRAALIAAAEAELAEHGVAGFTLRGTARRAGVSHAAPAHHFKDTAALLTELATIGFRRLEATTAEYGRAAGAKGTLDYIVGAARGYLAFAMTSPHLFALVFQANSFDCEKEDYIAAGTAAFQVPVEAVGAYYGVADPMADQAMSARVIGLWSIVHGFSDLILSKHLVSPGVTENTLTDQLLPAIVRQFFNGVPPAPPPTQKRRR